MADPTIAQLKERAATCPVRALSLQILLWDFDPPSYDAWVEHVERALLHQVNLIAEKKHYLKSLSEDALSTVVQIALDNLVLNCSAAVVNGNVDVVIAFGGYKWLGEAKIATDNAKIFHGYQQLTTRYATGQPGQTAGGMLLYCKDDRADAILNGWRAALDAAIPGAQIVDGPVPLSFRSVDNRNGSSQDLRIVHLAFPLFHVPEEDTWVLPKEAAEAGRLAKKATKQVAVKRQRDRDAASSGTAANGVAGTDAANDANVDDS